MPILAIASRVSPGAAFGWGWLGAWVFFLTLLHWLNFTFLTYSSIPWPLTWGPTMLLAGYCALWVGAVASAVSWIGRRRGPLLGLAATPFLWIAAEWGRGHLMSGFPWGLIGYSQYRTLAVIQIAELGGVYAVSFVLVAVNAALAAAFVASFRRAAGVLAVAALLVAVTLGFGAARLSAPPPADSSAVALMQPSIEQPLKWDERFAERVLDTYFRLTGSIGRGRADLIVWPETAAPTVLRRDPGLTGTLTAMSAELAAPLLVGSVDVDDGPPQKLRNTAFLLRERGVSGRYDKMHLVPFGEYVPLSGVIGFVRSWAEFISEMEPGSDATVFPGPPAPFGVVICYEGIFPELFRSFIKGGARLMVNMTNDAWFGRTSGPLQHLAMYPLRAVEHRVAVARAANTGVSAFIAPTGRILRQLGLFERGVMIERVPLRSGETLYTRFGDWLVYLGFLASGAALAFAAMAGRR